ncbi:hypothetical protein ABPG77_011079 [Micractinium sp. CCAP 211/92]
MDPRRTSAQLRACVADLQEYFASAASPAHRRRFSLRMEAANTLGDLIRQLSEQEAALAQQKDVLLSLTSGLDAVTAAAAGIGQPGVGTPPPGQDLLKFIASWYSLLGTADVVAYNLLVFVNPEWSSEAEQKRLAASVTACAGAICAACGSLARLWREQQSACASEVTFHMFVKGTDACLRQALDVIGAGLRCVADGTSTGSDSAAKAQAAALSAQLQPERVLGWLRGALDVVEWVVSTAVVEQSTCLRPLLDILGFTPCSVCLGLYQALCSEPDLLSRLAQQTARAHAALVAAPNWADAAWSERHDSLSLWAGHWGLFPLTPENQQAALLPLLVAGGSMLRGEVSLLASLPAQPPVGADAKQAGRLATCWLAAISMIGRCASLQCSTASRELSRNQSSARLRSLLAVVAASAPHVLRFVSAGADIGPAAKGVSRVEGPCTTNEVLNLWAGGCWFICRNCRVLGPAGSPQQQHETAGAVAGLLGLLLPLLGQLPRLAEASGEPLNIHSFLKFSAEASILLAHR